MKKILFIILGLAIYFYAFFGAILQTSERYAPLTSYELNQSKEVIRR